MIGAASITQLTLPFNVLKVPYYNPFETFIFHPAFQGSSLPPVRTVYFSTRFLTVQRAKEVYDGSFLFLRFIDRLETYS